MSHRTPEAGAQVYNGVVSTRTKPAKIQTKATKTRTRQHPVRRSSSTSATSSGRDPMPIPNHSLAPLAGKYADDQAFAELMDEVWKNRERERREAACDLQVGRVSVRHRHILTVLPSKRSTHPPR